MTIEPPSTPMPFTKRTISWPIAGASLVFATVIPALAQPAPPSPAPPVPQPAVTPGSEPAVTPVPAPPAATPPAAPAATPPPTYYVPPAYPAAPAPLVPRRDPRVANAHADRVVLLPTAYTHPEGTLYFSSNELVLLQAGYALSDQTQITLTGLPPLSEGPDQVYFFDLSLKGAFVRKGPLRLAALGSAMGVFGIEHGNFVLGRVGAVAELCFDRECESSASLGSHVMLAGPGTMMVNGVGAIWRVSDGAALLLEVDTAVPLGGEIGEYSGILVAPGFRFPYKSWSLDLAVMRPLDTEEEPELAVLPWISFTYRFLP
ncbi:MAG: hypothetical protein HYZ29_30055 [Myxococcales bacterium]|nr:hypothetical protein [Myxococcales bacterium]